MENQDIIILFNLNKIVSFLFKLNIDINKGMLNRDIYDEIDCMNFIKSEIVKSNIFKFENEDGLNNIRDQIFVYFFDNNFIGLPLSLKIKELSLIN